MCSVSFGAIKRAEDRNDMTYRHLRFMSERLTATLNVEDLCDTTFVVQGEKVFASRLVLAAASEYFEAMFRREGLSESQLNKPIKIIGVDKPTFMFCLRHLYSGYVDLTSENVSAILKAADMFQIGTLIAACGRVMTEALGADNCLHFLAAVDQLPQPPDDLRTACLDLLERELDAVVSGADFAESVEQLSFQGVQDLCTRVGQGLSEIPAPAACLSRVMSALTLWGQRMWGSSSATPQGLYWRAREEFCRKVEGHTVDWRFDVTQDQLSQSGIVDWSSDAFVVSGHSFKTNLKLSSSNGSRFAGAFLLAVGSTDFPSWWQCHAAFDFEFTTPLKRRYSDPKPSNMSSCWGWPEILELDAQGVPRMTPPGVGPLPNADVRVTLEGRTTVHVNALVSFCLAHAFFVPMAWKGIRSTDLSCILLSDDLPVTSEDAVLTSLLSYTDDQDELKEVLQHLRWHFLSPAALRDACGADGSQAFRNCSTTKEVLRWLVGQSSEPEYICRRRRAAYAEDVVDNCHSFPATLIEALLNGGSITKARTATIEARALAAERRAEIAEKRAMAAERELRDLRKFSGDDVDDDAATLGFDFNTSYTIG